MKREHQDSYQPPASPTTMGGKFKMLDKGSDAGGVDELLAALGYKVRSSDMADVALKLEQLDMVMGTSASQDDAVLSHLASDTVHYNPSDLSTWLESMLSELNTPPPPLPPPAHPQHPNPFDFAAPPASTSPIFDSPGGAESSTVYGSDPAATTTVGSGSFRDRKRMKTMNAASSSSSSSRGGGGAAAPAPAPAQRPPLAPASSSEVSSLSLVVVDSQEAGIRLVHTLMACADAVQHENYKAADTLVNQIYVLAASQGGAMRKVADYFAQALARRIYRLHPQQDCSLESAFSDILQMHFYESCPYLKFAHFTANQAILEAFEGCRRVHVIDFGMKQGMQWPALMQALAFRSGGPPSFRLTGIGPPQPDNTDALQQVGWKLAQLANAMHVDFEYRGFVAKSLADLEPCLLEPSLTPTRGNTDLAAASNKEFDAVAVNSVFELHRLLARPGAIEKVLNTVKAIKPKIVTVVEQEANHNSGSFSDRFTEALHYYSTMFDSLEGGNGSDSVNGGQQDQVMTEVYLGRQICNVVACEGVERTERHESLAQWRNRFGRAGFEPVHLGSNAFKQASLLLALFAGGDGYRVEEKDGCLTLGWHTRPLIATSAWGVADR